MMRFQVGHTSAGEKSPLGGAKLSHLSLEIACGLRVHSLSSASSPFSLVNVLINTFS